MVFKQSLSKNSPAPIVNLEAPAGGIDACEQFFYHLSPPKINDRDVSPEFQQILFMLKEYTGHDFSAYKLTTIYRRIDRQMHIHQIKNVTDYLEFLRTNSSHLGALFKDLLIGVTNFFRDNDAFVSLKDILASKLNIMKKQADFTFRVWIPGCSTGEEAYSVAIIFRELMLECKTHFDIKIFGTDLDFESLEIARSGIYPLSIATEMSDKRLKKFFIKEKNKYKVKKEIRDMITFGEHNVRRIQKPSATNV